MSFQSTLFKKKIELHGTVTVKGKWNRAKQEINGNRMFFNEQTTQDDVQLEPVYRIKEELSRNKFEIISDKR